MHLQLFSLVRFLHLHTIGTTKLSTSFSNSIAKLSYMTVFSCWGVNVTISSACFFPSTVILTSFAFTLKQGCLGCMIMKLVLVEDSFLMTISMQFALLTWQLMNQTRSGSRMISTLGLSMGRNCCLVRMRKEEVMYIQMQFNIKKLYLIINKKIGYAVQISPQGDSKYREVELGPANQNNDRQFWNIEQGQGKLLHILNSETETVLVENKEKVALSRIGTSHGWFINSEQPTSCTISYRDNGRTFYLTAMGGTVSLRQLIKITDCQEWQLREVKNNVKINQTCFIESVQTGEVIDAPNSTLSEGTQFIMYHPHYRYNQRFLIYRAGDVYVIKNYKSGLNLDVESANFLEGGKVIQWHPNGDHNQFWLLEKSATSSSQFRIACYHDRQFELAYQNGNVVIHKGRQFQWRIEK